MKLIQTCKICGKSLILANNFYETNSRFFPNGYVDICKSCLEEMLDPEDFGSIDAFCRYGDYAFLINEYTSIIYNGKTFHDYFALFGDAGYRSLGWKEMNDKWADKMFREQIELEIDALRQDKLNEYKSEWGPGFEEDELMWLQNYFIDMHRSYEIKTASQRDYLRKICKVSLLIDRGLARNEDVKDLTNMYDKFMKSANFTESGGSTMNSMSEIVEYYEREGFLATFLDDHDQDQVDETMRDIQEYLKNLVENEPGLVDIVSAMRDAKESKEKIQGIVRDEEVKDDNLSSFKGDDEAQKFLEWLNPKGKS